MMLGRWRRIMGSARLLMEFLLIVAACEVVVMFLLPWLAPGVSHWQEALLDATMLATLAAPLVAWRANRMVARVASAPSALEEFVDEHGLALPVLVFAIGAGLTAALAWGVYRQSEQSARTRFDHAVVRLEGQLKERFDRVRGGLGEVVRASDVLGHPLRRQDLRNWMAGRDWLKEVPGTLALSIVQPLARNDMALYEAHLQAEGHAGFRIRTAGQAPDLYIVDAIEPQQGFRSALGFDLGSEPVRREAIQRAVDSGLPALSGRVTLVQEARRRVSLLYLMPMYDKGMPLTTVVQRRAALRALTSVPIVVDELLQGVDAALQGQIRFTLMDTARDGTLHRLAGTARQAGQESQPRFARELDLNVGGRTLQLQVHSTPGFDEDNANTMAVWLGMLGLMLSAMAAVSVWLMISGRVRAQSMAEAMTKDLLDAQGEAERASREGAALIATLNQFSMVCVTNPAGDIMDVNDALCETTGYSKEELLGQNPRLFGSGEHDPFFWIAAWQTLLHGQLWMGEVCNRRKNGELYWVQCVISPVMDARGVVDKYISIAYDITQTHRAQDELKANAERYNLAIDGGSDGMWDWMNVNAQEEWWSPQFYRLLGYEPNEIPANMQTFDAMLHPEDQNATFVAIEKAFKDHQPFDIEYRLKTKSGAYRWFRSRAKVYFDDFGAATRMAGSIQDVHDRKEAQAKLREHSQQMSAIFSLSPDAFVSFDLDGSVSYISPAWSHLTGISSHGLIGASEEQFGARLFERTVPGQAVSSMGALHQLRHADSIQGESVDGGRVVIEMKPPARRMLEFRLSRSEVEAVSQVLHLRDVTHETEVDQMKSAFLSMAAHELRTPMASIYGFTELLLTRELKPEKQKDLLGRIYRQSEAMAGIINELLDLARIEARQGKDFSFKAVNLADLVGDVIRDFKLPQDRQAPLTEWPDEPIMVWVDRQKMQQATLNVLSNAYKYSPNGGDVHVRVVTQVLHGKPQVGVQIEDHGLGLSPEQLARVGERFYRADKSGSIPGTGLGVTIVKEIIELMGGHVAMRSEQGKGSAFTLWLPCMEGSPSQFAQFDELAPSGLEEPVEH